MGLEKEGSTAGIAFTILLLVILIGSLYFLYLNLPGDPIDLVTVDGTIEDEGVDINYGTSEQFYENMRFSEKRISYKIGTSCNTEKIADIDEAFSILESKTILDFIKVQSGKGDIEILCSEISPEAGDEDYFVAGEGGPSEVINSTLYSVILSGKASFFREERCENPNIALHEILHVLGFDHNDNPDSILFPTLDCDQTIDEEIIDNINELYSVDSLADLKIDELDATKSGRYLNFEIVVINQGLKDAEDVYLTLYYDGKKVEFEGTKDALSLGDIKIGTRKILTVENAKISRNSKEIIFIVDEENEIKEIFENNNEMKLGLA